MSDDTLNHKKKMKLMITNKKYKSNLEKSFEQAFSYLHDRSIT